MASTAGADANATESSSHENRMNTEHDVTESTNHDLPARTLVEDKRPEQTEHTRAQKDDPATVAASEELKHTSLSDKVSRVQPLDDQTDEDKDMGETVRVATPETDPTDAQDEEMKERLASPKKKRGRDQEDDSKELEDDVVDEPGSSADASVVNGSRTTRLEPEKKRPRDTSEDLSKPTETVAEVKMDSAPADSAKTEPTKSEDKKSDHSQKEPSSSESAKPQTSASAFASSGFASLAATSTSPFGSLGASKSSVFGGNTQPAPSGFAALASAKPADSPSTTTPATSSFATLGSKPATGFNFRSGATSGFGGLGSGSVFGSKLGNGFAGGAGPKLSSFAAPGKDEIQGTKPAKAFGAPESDEEADSDEDEDSEGAAANEDEESGKLEADDKKKVKLTKVHIDDGEAGEATLLQMRAKVFAMENKEAGWKERGVGTLKINVPKACVSYDENGQPIPGSFDASGLEDENADPNAPKVPRLIMRQENTHRVILNTIIVRAMAFTDKPASSAAQILFTAFEGDKEPKPVNILLKMSEANHRLFRNELSSIQAEL